MRPELIAMLRKVDILPMELDLEGVAETAALRIQYTLETGEMPEFNEPERAYLPGTPQWVIDRDKLIYNLASELILMEENDSGYSIIEAKLWEELNAYEDLGWTGSEGYNDNPLSVVNSGTVRRSLGDAIYGWTHELAPFQKLLADMISGDAIIATETHYSPRYQGAQTGVIGVCRDAFVTGDNPLIDNMARALAKSIEGMADYGADFSAGGSKVPVFQGEELFYDNDGREPRPPFHIMGILNIMDAPGPIDSTRFEGLRGTSLSKEDIRRAYIGKEGVPPATGSSQTEMGLGPE